MIVIDNISCIMQDMLIVWNNMYVMVQNHFIEFLANMILFGFLSKCSIHFKTPPGVSGHRKYWLYIYLCKITMTRWSNMKLRPIIRSYVYNM